MRNDRAAPDSARARWKAAYRRARINRRELLLTVRDLVCFGNSVFYLDSHTGQVRHIPVQEAILEATP